MDTVESANGFTRCSRCCLRINLLNNDKGIMRLNILVTGSILLHICRMQNDGD